MLDYILGNEPSKRKTIQVQIADDCIKFSGLDLPRGPEELHAWAASQELSTDEWALAKRLVHIFHYQLNHPGELRFIQLCWKTMQDELAPFQFAGREIKVTSSKSRSNQVFVAISELKAFSIQELIPFFNREMLDLMADSVIITDAEPLTYPGPRVMYSNRAFEIQTGFSFLEMKGKSPRVLQGPQTNEGSKLEIRSSLENRETSVVEVLNYKKDGTPFFCELKITPLLDQTGWVTNYMSVQRDITDRRRKEECLRAKERVDLIQQVGSALVQDLNHQLGLISTRLDLTSKQLVAAGQGSILNQLALVKESLLSTKEKIGHFAYLNEIKEIKPKPIDLYARIYQVLLSKLEPHKISFEVVSKGAKPLSALLLDDSLLVQIFSELAENAISSLQKVPQSDRLVRVEIRYPEVTDQKARKSPDQAAMVRVSFSDSGGRIDKVHSAKIFNPFFSTEDGKSSRGLYLAQANAIRLGGYLYLLGSSSRGSTFELGLRMELDSGQFVGIESNKTPQVQYRKILLVEDEEALGQVLKELLEIEGYEVRWAQSADEAIKALDEERYAAILCDFVLGKGEFADRIFKYAQIVHPGLHFVFMSGGAALESEEMRKAVEDVPHVFYLQKPFDIHDFLSRVPVYKAEPVNEGLQIKEDLSRAI